MSNLTKLEMSVIEKLLKGEHPILVKLRQQLNICSVTKRELTGVGFYTTFHIPDIVKRVSGRTFKFGDVVAEIDGMSHGAGFLLYITDCVLDMLEGYSYDEPWPNNVQKYKLEYMNGPNRDWAQLDKILETKCNDPN